MIFSSKGDLKGDLMFLISGIFLILVEGYNFNIHLFSGTKVFI